MSKESSRFTSRDDCLAYRKVEVSCKLRAKACFSSHNQYKMEPGYTYDLHIVKDDPVIRLNLTHFTNPHSKNYTYM